MEMKTLKGGHPRISPVKFGEISHSSLLDIALSKLLTDGGWTNGKQTLEDHKSSP